MKGTHAYRKGEMENVWLCVAMCDYVWLCVAICGYVWLCVAMCGYMWLCVAICGGILIEMISGAIILALYSV